MSISKTIRLPDSLVEYIELQEGDNFSEKLVRILHEYRQGDDERQKAIRLYRESIDKYKNLYGKLVSDYGEARRILIQTTKYLDDMRQLASSTLDDSLIDPELAPGSLPFT